MKNTMRGCYGENPDGKMYGGVDMIIDPHTETGSIGILFDRALKYEVVIDQVVDDGRGVSLSDYENFRTGFNTREQIDLVVKVFDKYIENIDKIIEFWNEDIY